MAGPVMAGIGQAGGQVGVVVLHGHMWHLRWASAIARGHIVGVHVHGHDLGRDVKEAPDRAANVSA